MGLWWSLFFLNLFTVILLDSWREQGKCIRNRCPWDRVLNKEKMSLLFTFLSAIFLLYCYLTCAFKGTYEVLNKLSVRLYQDISWWQFKESAYTGSLYTGMFSYFKNSVFSLHQEKQYRRIQRNNISFKWESERPKKKKKSSSDYQGIKRSQLKM